MAGAGAWSRSIWTDAGQLVSLIDPDGDPGNAAGQSLQAWHACLVESGEIRAALAFLAHALPRYECVVWAAQALIEAGAVERKDPLVVAVLQWIDDPDDAKRRSAGDAAEAVRKTTPAKLLGHAVFLSGGSLAPKDLPPVQPPPDVCAKLAAGAVLLGAHSLPDPPAALRKALALGEAIVTGD